MKRTRSLIAVAVALMAEPFGKHWGYALGREARVRSGVLYPILRRMLSEGWLTDGWEDPSTAPGRPPRRYYELTDEGRRQLGSLRWQTLRQAAFAQSWGVRRECLDDLWLERSDPEPYRLRLRTAIVSSDHRQRVATRIRLARQSSRTLKRFHCGDRPFYVAEQLESALSDGLPTRWRERRSRGKAASDTLQLLPAPVSPDGGRVTQMSMSFPLAEIPVINTPAGALRWQDVEFVAIAEDGAELPGVFEDGA